MRSVAGEAASIPVPERMASPASSAPLLGWPEKCSSGKDMNLFRLVRHVCHDSPFISFAALTASITTSACGGSVASLEGSASDANVNLSPSDCVSPETLATFTADSANGAQLATFSSMAVGPDGTVYVSSIGPTLFAGTSTPLPGGIVAIPPDGRPPRSVTSDKRAVFGNVWVVGNTLYTFGSVFSAPTLSAIDASGATPLQPIWAPSAPMMTGYAFDATGFYYVAHSPGEAGVPLSAVRVSLDGTVTPLGSSSDLDSSPVGNVLLDEQFLYLIDQEGAWTMPKGGGPVVHVRSDVQSATPFSGLATAARSGSSFYAVNPSSALTRFTLDSSGALDPIAVTGSGPLANVVPSFLIGDDQGVYALFTSSGSVSAPSVLAAVAGPGLGGQATCFVQANPQAVEALAMDATYVYFSVQRADNIQVDVVRMRR